jgi:hypothetical protein
VSDSPVLILGCGPAGLLAAYAVELLGGSPAIMSRPNKSELPGAQYLHEPIPGLTGEPDGKLQTLRRGDAGGYAEKVYGNRFAPCSWTHHEGITTVRNAWDLRAVYDKLWAKYSPQVIPAEIDRELLDDVRRTFPLVISTVPATLLCAPEHRRILEGIEHHSFQFAKADIVDWAPPEIEDNTIHYSGDPVDLWYRSSRIFGHASTEFGRYADVQTRLGGYSELKPDARVETFVPKTGIKVVGTTCDCFPEIKRAGRFGTWTKGYLTHHAFRDATNYYIETFGAA